MALDAALSTDMPAYPTAAPKKPAPQIKSPAPAPGFDLGKAAAGVTDADRAASEAASAQGAAEGRLATVQGKYQGEQSKYVSGLHQEEAGKLGALDPGTFKPDENTLGNMAGLFTMVGMLGAFLGGKRTTASAANAQAALTGMLNGWSKGDQMEVARQKQIYDENAGYLKSKAEQVRDLYKTYEEDAVKLGVPTAQGKYLQSLLTEANADVLAARTKYAGAQSTQKQADDILKITEQMTNKQADIDTKVAMANLTAQIRWGIQGDKDDQQKAGFSPEAGDLMAALAERGVSLPTGLRSRQQQTALYAGLLARHPGKSPDEIAEMIKAGQIDLKAELKETQIAATIAGRVAVAENEIGPMGDLVMQSANKVPRGSFLPINKLLAASENQLQDPNLRTLKVRILSLLNAYDVLAARGGTDVDKRAAAHSLLTTADSPANLQAAVTAFKQEMHVARRAADAAEHHKGGATDGPQEGQTSKSKSGKPIIFRNGQWEYQ
jgi:hypothetical protein